MIGIKAIASFIPSGGLDNISQGSVFDEPEEFVREKIGARWLPVKDVSEDTSDLAVHAVRELFRVEPSLTPECIDAIVVVTQNPDGSGLPHTSALVQHKLELPHKVAAFDVSLGCSGYVYGLFLLRGFLESSGLSNGILITADPYSKVVDRGDRVTSMLFGDASTATWLGPNPHWKLGPVSYGTNGSGAEFLKVEAGKLQMNGRQVFNFAISQIEPHIKRLLSDNGFSPEDIDKYIIHQGSAAIVKSIARKFEGVSTRFVLDIDQTGNTVSSSIPLLLSQHGFDGDCKRIVVCGFGVGLSWASAIIHK
jgi:3-oxoacyl-[acyl-carrier-protein] synthase-3